MNNTTKTRTNKRNARTQVHIQAFDAESAIATLQDDIATLGQALQQILANISQPTPIALVPAKAKKASKNAAKNEAKKVAHAARVETINARVQEWANIDIAQAVKLAGAEIRANRKTGKQNAAIASTSPDSVRVWLTSPTNQALRKVRKSAGMTYADCEALLEKASK